MPFCGDAGVACHDPAPSKLQFAYAFFILLVGAVLRYLAGKERFKDMPGKRQSSRQRGVRVGFHRGCHLSPTPTPHSPRSPLPTLSNLSNPHSQGVDTVPAMVGMCVGWAYGDACLQLLAELKASKPERCAPPLYDTPGSPADCSEFDMLFSCGLLALSTVFIVLVQPLTKVT